MWFDNLSWLFKNRELNTFYTSYGLDIKNFRNPDDFIGHHNFCVNRNRGNQKNKYTITGSYNYIVLLRDKYIFSTYLSNAIGSEFVVQNRALLFNENVYLCKEKEWTKLEELLQISEPLVFKLIDGECAEGVMLVKIFADYIKLNEKTISRSHFLKLIKNNYYVIQDVVKQHEDLNVFKTRSVNTIRVITIKGISGEVRVFSCFLRLSGSKDSFVDNRAKGGLAIGINIENGKLMKYGYPHDEYGTKLKVHPTSGVRFEGFQLPFWENTIELVVKAHKQFYEIQSIGWDVIITPNGPVILEGNDDWEIGGPQDTLGGLKNRWDDLVNG